MKTTFTKAAPTKTAQAAAALIAAHPVANRGHAYMVLAAAGLTGSGQVFNGAVRAYEAHTGAALGKSASRQRAEREESLRAQAHQMTAEAVLEHIDSLDEADELFWACWKVFRHEGKWVRTLRSSDFAPLFRRA